MIWAELPGMIWPAICAESAVKPQPKNQPEINLMMMMKMIKTQEDRYA